MRLMVKLKLDYWLHIIRHLGTKNHLWVCVTPAAVLATTSPGQHHWCPATMQELTMTILPSDIDAEKYAKALKCFSFASSPSSVKQLLASWWSKALKHHKNVFIFLKTNKQQKKVVYLNHDHVVFWLLFRFLPELK